MIYVNNDHFLVVYDDVAIDEKKRRNHDNVLSGCVSIRVLVEIRKKERN